MKKLFLDIETSPHIAFVWRLRDENVGLSQLIEPTRMLCVASQFDGEKADFHAEWLRGGHRRMVRGIHAALDKADAVIHYNGISFDEKHLNREFLQYGLKPPSPYKTIDLYRVVKQRFWFASLKLEQVARELEIREGKLRVDFGLWRRVMDKDPTARKEMEVYNVEDIKLIVELYEELLPWIDRHPNAALFEGDELMRCTRCASTTLQRRGKAFTMAGAFQRYQCQDCGGWLRGSQRMATTPLREVGK